MDFCEERFFKFTPGDLVCLHQSKRGLRFTFLLKRMFYSIQTRKVYRYREITIPGLCTHNNHCLIIDAHLVFILFYSLLYRFNPNIFSPNSMSEFQKLWIFRFCRDMLFWDDLLKRIEFVFREIHFLKPFFWLYGISYARHLRVC